MVTEDADLSEDGANVMCCGDGVNRGDLQQAVSHLGPVQLRLLTRLGGLQHESCWHCCKQLFTSLPIIALHSSCSQMSRSATAGLWNSSVSPACEGMDMQISILTGMMLYTSCMHDIYSVKSDRHHAPCMPANRSWRDMITILTHMPLLASCCNAWVVPAMYRHMPARSNAEHGQSMLTISHHALPPNMCMQWGKGKQGRGAHDHLSRGPARHRQRCIWGLGRARAWAQGRAAAHRTPHRSWTEWECAG